MFRWLAGLGARDREVDEVLQRISPQQWQSVQATLPFLAGLSAEELDRLRYKTAWFLASKRFSAAHDLKLTDDMMLSIGMQACLPILNLDTSLYEGWTQVIVYPGAFMIPRSDVDAGVVHEYMTPASGEAWDGGPVILSWDDVEHDHDGCVNVVIHEFAHKLDLFNGQADGVPAITNPTAHAPLSNGDWHQCLTAALEVFRDHVDHVERSIPYAIDPMSDLADPWYASLPMDPYAASDQAEFFAVSSEVFFVSPERLKQAYPQWYEVLSRYYLQDPLGRLKTSP